jgi:hypothetical protein
MGHRFQDAYPDILLRCAFLAALGLAAPEAGIAQADTTSHGWPVAPFTSTHIITGTFCEFRNTLTADHFHNGIDIPMPDGTPVYSVYTGVITSIGTTASSGDNAFVRVRYSVSGLTKSDAYVHIAPNPRLQTGDTVFAHTTVIGNILPGLGHVHFTQGLSGSEINAIRPNGGMTPYIDNYPPEIVSVGFFVDGTETQFPGGRVSGAVDIRVHIKETSAANPSGLYSSTTNNGTYIAGYRVLSADGLTVVYEPPSGGVRFRFDRKPVDGDVHNVFAAGSDLSTHIYTITNGGGADAVNSTRRVGNGSWDTGALSPGPYRVVIWAEDTRGLRDSSVADLTVQMSDAVPPAPPVLLAVTGVGDDSVMIRWKGGTEPDLAGYRLSFTLNGLTWVVKADETALGPSDTSVTYPIGRNQAVFFRVVSLDGASPPNLSTPSDIYGIRIAPGRRTLVVDGFDRTEGSGSYHFADHPFAMTHARSIAGRFATCANDALLEGSVDLSGYDRVDWLLGDESEADRTFDGQEQALVKAYLDLTGKGMMISGSELAYDLDRPSGPAQGDRDFLRSYLKTAFAADDAGVYDVSGVPSTPFEGLSFRYGIPAEGSPYEEDWPDVIAPVNGGEALMRYGPGGSTIAAVGYRGVSPGGGSSALVTMGFPFETITSQGARDSLMAMVMTYLDAISGVAEPIAADVPAGYSLFQNYPNPFNPATSIRYNLPVSGETKLVVYDLLGREVAMLVDEIRPAGMHTVHFDGARLGSGIYYAVLTAGGQRIVRSMVLLK